MEKTILSLVDSILENQQMTPNINAPPNAPRRNQFLLTPPERQLLVDFRKVVSELSISPVPRYSKMSVEQINSLGSFYNNLVEINNQLASQTTTLPLNDIHFNLDYERLIGGKKIDFILTHIRKLHSQRKILVALLDRIKELDIKIASQTHLTEVSKFTEGLVQQSTYLKFALTLNELTSTLTTIARADDRAQQQEITSEPPE